MSTVTHTFAKVHAFIGFKDHLMLFMFYLETRRIVACNIRSN